MQFNDTTNKSGIIQFTESLCKLGDGGITNDTTLFKQITSYINASYAKIASAILRVDKYWKWDDSNYTTFPIATIDLEAGVRDYTLPARAVSANPSTLYKINKVQVLDASGVYQDLEVSEPGEKESPNSGVPTRYDLIGNSIRLSDIPTASSVTLTAGLRIFFQRSFDEFTTSDTTQEPGFSNAYHHLLAYDAASMYLLPFNASLATTYIQLFNAGLNDLKNDYAIRNDDVVRRMTVVPQNNK